MFHLISPEWPLTCVKLYTDLNGSTTDEVHDLEGVVVVKQRRVPVVATHDLAVKLHGDARDGQIELSD